MLLRKKLIKITGHIIFVITFIFFSTTQAKSLDKFNKAEYISDYFSGVILLNNNQYKESYKYLKNLDGLERSHENYSAKYLYSIINTGNFIDAFNYSKKLEKNKLDSFETNIIMGVYYFKNSNYKLAKKYLLKTKNQDSKFLLNLYLVDSLLIWSNLDKEKIDIANLELDNLDKRFGNLNEIQKVFLNCFFDNPQTQSLYKNLTISKANDFSRYNYFYANYLKKQNNTQEAKKVINESLKKYPRNILLNQMKIDLEKTKSRIEFDCKKPEHVISEILYVAANLLSSQSIYPISNFYLYLSKYLNPNFPTENLLADNSFEIEDYRSAKKIYKSLNKYGSSYKWYSAKQISRILILEGEKQKSIKFLTRSYEDIPNKGIYENFDYAQFLKNNEKFDESIYYYSEILKNIDNKHIIYPEVTDGRGVAYERIGKWESAEKDLLNSLRASPDQAYVINYLAYSWIEQGVKIQKSLDMLRKADRLKNNDPYIIDSLGWALFKLNRYKESKNYLQKAVTLLPSDPIVNDHFGDVLWMNGKKIQARYYWNYVLGLEDTEQDLKNKIKEKLIKGL